MVDFHKALVERRVQKALERNELEEDLTVLPKEVKLTPITTCPRGRPFTFTPTLYVNSEGRMVLNFHGYAEYHYNIDFINSIRKDCIEANKPLWIGVGAEESVSPEQLKSVFAEAYKLRTRLLSTWEEK